MPTTVDVFPDAEAVTSIHLRAQATSVATRVYSRLPSEPSYPLARVQRVGGTPITRMRLDAADIQFDVYGASQSQARLAASQIRAAMFLAEGTTITVPGQGDAFVTGVTDVQGLTWMPDTSNPVANRYVFSMRVYLHAA